MGWISPIVLALVAVLKVFFGTDKLQKRTVEHPEPHIEVTGGQTDVERLADLGL